MRRDHDQSEFGVPDFNLDADRGYAWKCWDWNRHNLGRDPSDPNARGDLGVRAGLHRHRAVGLQLRAALHATSAVPRRQRQPAPARRVGRTVGQPVVRAAPRPAAALPRPGADDAARGLRRRPCKKEPPRWHEKLELGLDWERLLHKQQGDRRDDSDEEWRTGDRRARGPRRGAGRRPGRRRRTDPEWPEWRDPDPGWQPDPDLPRKWREIASSVAKEHRPRREDVYPYLLIRAVVGDRGARPTWPPKPCWESPDILLIDASYTGEFDPARLVVSPVAGRSYRVFVRIWNLGLSRRSVST